MCRLEGTEELRMTRIPSRNRWGFSSWTRGGLLHRWREPKAVTIFPGQKSTAISSIKFTVPEHDTLRWRICLLTNLTYFRPAFAESNVDGKWVRFTFSDDSTLAYKMAGLILVYMSWRALHVPKYVDLYTQWSCAWMLGSDLALRGWNT